MMEWWLICLAIGIMSFCLGLCVALLTPRASLLDTFLNYMLLLIILFGGLTGIVCLAYGLRK
jgi:uncharacterized membrane protein YjjP (DUF1212 family)